jgi:DNA-binding NarL/FixJ family response regulator
MTSVRLKNLTTREREVLSLISLGLSNAQIRDRLVRSEATVKTHISRILMKTGSHDRGQAIVLAYQSGLVVPGQTVDPT